jgi:hypothetical protein
MSIKDVIFKISSKWDNCGVATFSVQNTNTNNFQFHSGLLDSYVRFFLIMCLYIKLTSCTGQNNSLERVKANKNF